MTKESIVAGEAIEPYIQPIPDLERDVGEDVILVDQKVYLKASRSASSGVLCFPAQDLCPKTGARDMQPLKVGPEAKLYSYSNIHVSARYEVPYSIAYIDFPEGLRVLARLRNPKDLKLSCECSVSLKSEGSEWWVEPLTTASGAPS